MDLAGGLVMAPHVLVGLRKQASRLEALQKSVAPMDRSIRCGRNWKLFPARAEAEREGSAAATEWISDS
jgi:hypothetical protein